MIVAVALFFVMQGFQASSTGPIELSADGQVDVRKPRNYCGIYTAFGAASVLLQKSGKKPAVDFGDLISNEYVSSMAGSTTQDILRALEKLGCSGQAYAFLSLRSIERAKNPLILHVSSRGRLGSYQHWILFLGIESGCAVVRDGEGGDYKMPESELLCKWDGKAIAVFQRDEQPPKLYAWEIAANCLYLFGVCSIICLVRSMSVLKSFRAEFASFVCVISLAVAYSFFANAHSYVDSAIARSVGIHTYPESIREISFAELQEFRGRSKASIVDCRYKVDYSFGHIDDSISIPIDISPANLAAATKSLRRDIPIILYCQSEGCKFSDVMASEFAKLGFTDLNIYRNGYTEWETRVR